MIEESQLERRLFFRVIFDLMGGKELLLFFARWLDVDKTVLTPRDLVGKSRLERGLGRICLCVCFLFFVFCFYWGWDGEKGGFIDIVWRW